MNYYERIEKSIDFIEQNLAENINPEQIASKAFMSRAGFYRIFFSLTGYPVKEYIRRRRLAEASKEMLSASIIEAAFKFGFNNHETFSRAFKKVTNSTPSNFKQNGLIINFERIKIMEKYFERQDKVLLEKYPDIKVLKELKPFKVAYYCYKGIKPEENAFKTIRTWLQKEKRIASKARIFGFNNPSPKEGETEYGYEVWVTIDKEQVIDDEKIKTKMVPGGLYGVTTVKGGVEAIFPTWQRFAKWLSESKYEMGNHQWLEEHLGFDHDFNHVGTIDLFIPIKK